MLHAGPAPRRATNIGYEPATTLAPSVQGTDPGTRPGQQRKHPTADDIPLAIQPGRTPPGQHAG